MEVSSQWSGGSSRELGGEILTYLPSTWTKPFDEAVDLIGFPTRLARLRYDDIDVDPTVDPLGRMISERCSERQGSRIWGVQRTFVCH